MDFKNISKDNINKSSKIIFITGGTKSGKSEFAEYLAKNSSQLTYIALSQKRSEDENWKKKISMHRKRRPITWKIIETSDLITLKFGSTTGLSIEEG